MSFQIGELVVEMRGDIARLREDMSQGRKLVQLTTQDMLNQMKNLEGVMSRVNWAASLHLLEKGLQYATQAFMGLKRAAIDNADQLNKLAQSTGWTVETLSAMRYAAELSDVQMEGLTKSLKSLSVNMVEAGRGNKEMAAIFGQLKVPLQASDEALLTLAERFQAMPDGPQKAALAVKLFGKEGMAMIPFLNQGRDGIAQLTDEARRFGLVISGETAR